MNKLFKRLSVFIGALLISMSSFAQQQEDAQELMRSNGKIYVVVASCFIIVAGLFLYAFLIDRKISKLEKRKLNLPASKVYIIELTKQRLTKFKLQFYEC